MGSPRRGDIVRHSKFGEGQVIEVKEGKVDVAFGPGKIMTILTFFLERIGHEAAMRYTPQPKPKTARKRRPSRKSV